MKRFLWFCLGMVIATALLINMGCVTASAQGTFMDELMKELEGPSESYQVPEDIVAGWMPTSDSGNHWILRDYIGGKLTVLGKCDYSYMKVRGVEKWEGEYFGMTDSMNFHGPVFNHDLPNLVGCFNWVQNFYYGDYMI